MGTSSRDPEHATDNPAMVEHGSADDGLLGWQQRGDPRPLLIGQGEIHGPEDLHLGATTKDCVLLGSARGVARFGNGLMPATERGPSQAEGDALRRLDECEEQTPDLGHRQWEELRGPPFSA